MASEFQHTDSSMLNLWLRALPQMSKPTVKHRDDCLRLLPGRDLGVPTRGFALQHEDPTVRIAHGIQKVLQVVHRVLLEHLSVFSLTFIFELVFVWSSETTVNKSPTPQ